MSAEPRPATQHLLHPRPYPRMLSIVIPMHNEEAVIPALQKEVTAFLQHLKCDTEVVLVNDGSTDGTLSLTARWAEEDARVRILHLSRNFGHQLAATAGLDFASGDAIVLIDADLQDPLEVIDEMISRYCEGYDVAYGQRESRAGEGQFKRVSAWIFYRLMQYLTQQNQLPVDTGDFRLLSRECLDSLKLMRETHRFLRGMVTWVGYPQVAVHYDRRQRNAGESKYPLHKMFALAWTAATSFSSLPLRLSFGIGLIFGLLGIEEACRALVERFLGRTVVGWTSLMAVTCILGSAILTCISVLGEYVGKLYEQAKGRPLYIVARTINVQRPRRDHASNC